MDVIQFKKQKKRFFFLLTVLQWVCFYMVVAFLVLGADHYRTIFLQGHITGGYALYFLLFWMITLVYTGLATTWFITLFGLKNGRCRGTTKNIFVYLLRAAVAGICLLFFLIRPSFTLLLPGIAVLAVVETPILWWLVTFETPQQQLDMQWIIFGLGAASMVGCVWFFNFITGAGPEFFGSVVYNLTVGLFK
ncbi:hypothetical protein LJC61_03000 [Ruminococcaceae bacterium OttesenSCG-928-A16]|nr:hypothetical protein [Ruminococcaceae bacterium OttesenSCG-928-A16]